MPLPNTRIIHPRWQDHHQPVILGTMTAWVRLSHPGGLGVRDPVTGRTPEMPPTPYYEGPGRVQARGGTSPADTPSDRELATGAYLVAVPYDIDGVPERFDLVDVLAGDDPLMIGQRLYVVDIPTASVILQRSFGCDLNRPNRGG